MKFKKEPRIPATKGCKLNALPPPRIILQSVHHWLARCPSPLTPFTDSQDLTTNDI
jgi:hypothetical protein